MRTKFEIMNDHKKADRWEEESQARKLFELGLLIEVLCDIRDQLAEIANVAMESKGWVKSDKGGLEL